MSRSRIPGALPLPIATVLLALALVVFSGLSTPARAEEPWQARFDEVCSKTMDAMSLSSDELKGFIVACDELQPLIDQSDATVRKVYLRRLAQCRSLYQFVLESKAAESKEGVKSEAGR